MLLGQKVHPLSFEYASRWTLRGDSVEIAGDSFAARVRCDAITDFCARIRIENLNVRDPRHYSDGVLEQHREGRPIQPGQGKRARFTAPSATIEIGASALSISLPHGMKIATGAEGFGFNGVKSIFQFEAPNAAGFYGFGERTGRFNKNGESMEFYTIDVMGVLIHSYWRDDYDPTYVSIPLAIIRDGGQCCGLYFDSPERLVMDCGKTRPGTFMTQVMDGHTRLYVINGPTLRDVVRNFTALTGRAELPPAWSIGYHQCRWGYKSEEEFKALAEKFARHDLPVSGLWYDIDYMDGYRVFTWDRKDFPRPRKLTDMLRRQGVRSVAIIDPGVKAEPGYPVYESGKAAGVFCKAPSGRDYTGRVWPGDTVFPDFTIEEGRQWWAEKVARFLDESGIDGAWLDMNDPSTGWCDTDDMLFDSGKIPHARYHNQYGHFMAQASRMAFEKLDPSRRAFLLTRSAFAGTQRYSALWTGDNDSNWKHLRMSIPSTINLGLSGIAFNGPDVGGFAGNTTEKLLVRWHQAGFLFPFFRNHSAANSKPQEPWQFGPKAMARIRDVLWTRYRLLPYLYQLFFEHHLTGDPILRPMLYEFENVDDQFMAGPAIMAAPILDSDTEGEFVVSGGARRQMRHIVLPKGWWYDLNTGEWIEGGRTIRYGASMDEVPLFVREGSIIPWYDGTLKNGDTPTDDFELHVFAREGTCGATLYLDDQETRKYLDGEFNKATAAVTITGGEAALEIAETGPRKRGLVNLDRAVFYGAPALKTLVRRGKKSRELKPARRRWIGKSLPVRAWS
jgi:alpha-glucosidase